MNNNIQNLRIAQMCISVQRIGKKHIEFHCGRVYDIAQLGMFVKMCNELECLLRL